MDLIPAISTAANKPPRDYSAYLLSPAWRETRNAALKRARFQCSRCGSRRELQVHHKTYERVGRELASDLDVVCAPCHEGLHPQEQEFRYARRYVLLARELLQRGRFESMVDFTDALKVRCAQLRLPYNTEKLARAVDIVLSEERPHFARAADVAAEFIAEQHTKPYSAEEARDMLRRLGLYEMRHQILPKMAQVERLTAREVDCMKAQEMVAREIQASLARCAELEAAVAKDRETA